MSILNVKMQSFRKVQWSSKPHSWSVEGLGFEPRSVWAWSLPLATSHWIPQHSAIHVPSCQLIIYSEITRTEPAHSASFSFLSSRPRFSSIEKSKWNPPCCQRALDTLSSYSQKCFTIFHQPFRKGGGPTSWVSAQYLSGSKSTASWVLKVSLFLAEHKGVFRSMP